MIRNLYLVMYNAMWLVVASESFYRTAIVCISYKFARKTKVRLVIAHREFVAVMCNFNQLQIIETGIKENLEQRCCKKWVVEGSQF